MRRQSWLVILAVFVAALFLMSCAKKSVVKEEGSSQKETVAGETKSDAKAGKKRTKKEVEKSDDQVREERAAVKEKAKKKVAKATAKAKKDLYEFVDVHFDYDKFTLTDQARAILDRDAEWLKKNSDANITIEGHCDERGTAEYNLALGERRANAAAKYLADLGIEGNRIKTISYGFERPVDQSHNEAAWSKNRRAHAVVSDAK